jgi:hypothetical protein
MRKHSRLIEEAKKEELAQYKNLSPDQRIAVAVAHNKLIKEIFYAGLTELGFKKNDINKIYHDKNRMKL